MMATHKRKKLTRYRGSKTHGGGSMKKRRGAGNRGGRGKAGTGKRADTNKPSIWKNRLYFGKHGFKPHSGRKDVKGVNVGYLNDKIEGFAQRGTAAEKSSSYEIDISRLGFRKLLGSGNVTKKMNIKADCASERAVEKIKKAGGNVALAEKAKEERSSKAEQDTAGQKQHKDKEHNQKTGVLEE